MVMVFPMHESYTSKNLGQPSAWNEFGLQSRAFFNIWILGLEAAATEPGTAPSCLDAFTPWW
jgi:hypothetical protein